MTDRQPRTVRVDPDVWDEFTAWVEQCEGRTWGEIGRHLEIAMREHMDADRAARMEEKLDEVLAAVSEGDETHTHRETAVTDGSGNTCDADEDYTAENVAQAEPPKTNAPIAQKIDYLTAVVAKRHDKSLHKQKFIDTEIQPVWDYADKDRATALAEKTIERAGFKQHPKADPLYVPKHRHEELKAEQKQQQKDAVGSQLDQMDAADTEAAADD
jgi:hypothetical protein